MCIAMNVFGSVLLNDDVVDGGIEEFGIVYLVQVNLNTLDGVS